MKMVLLHIKFKKKTNNIRPISSRVRTVAQKSTHHNFLLNNNCEKAKIQMQRKITPQRNFSYQQTKSEKRFI